MYKQVDSYARLLTLYPEGSRLSSFERLMAARGPLLSWYRENRRRLPWRETADAYAIWISEIMLQQTRVEAVKPYYARFMELFPTVWELKEAPDDLLLKCWEGLGYYSRARNLKKAAAVIVNQYGGRLPASYEGLLSLPGIGSYTAGAIGSITYGLPVPAVDGNVMRVLSRVTGSREDIGKQQTKRQMERLVKQVLEETKKERPRNLWDGDLEAHSGSGRDGFPENLPGDFNQALIETGAVLCVPNGEPLCGGCPFRTVCAAKIEGLTGLLPVKSPKKKRKIEEKTVLLLEYQDKIAIRKRAEEGLLASLYEFPNESAALNKEELSRLFSGRVKRIEELCEAKHIFSHTEWHMKGYFLSLTDPEIGVLLEAGEPVFFVEWKELKERYALPNAFQAYRRFLEGYFEGRDPKAAGKERHGGQ